MRWKRFWNDITDGHIGELDREELTTRELLARHLPKSKIVKVFNAIQAADIEKDGQPASGLA